MRLLLLGATGLVGSRTLKLALSNDVFSEVIAPTRKPLAPTERLVNPVMSRIEEIAPALKSYKLDAVVCALGTTQAKAGSQQAFRYVDYELPIALGEAAHAAGVETYAIVTAMGASADSMIFYSRTKGEVERGHPANRVPIPYDLQAQPHWRRAKRSKGRGKSRADAGPILSSNPAKEIPCQSSGCYRRCAA